MSPFALRQISGQVGVPGDFLNQPNIGDLTMKNGDCSNKSVDLTINNADLSNKSWVLQ